MNSSSARSCAPAADRLEDAHGRRATASTRSAPGFAPRSRGDLVALAMDVVLLDSFGLQRRKVSADVQRYALQLSCPSTSGVK